MKKHFYLYQITNNLNGKIYVGVHQTANLQDGYMGSGKVIQRALAKHGVENFTKVILETFEDEKSMYAREAELVNDEFLSREDVYNIRRGGLGGFDHINDGSDEHIERCKRAAAISLTPDNRSKSHETQRKNGLGVFNPDVQMFHSEEHRKKFFEAGLAALKTDVALQNRIKKFEEIGHQQGSKNSQFGSLWITDSVFNRKVKMILQFLMDGEEAEQEPKETVMQILTLDSGGMPHRWSSMKRALKLKAEGLIAWEYGHDLVTTVHGGTSRLTGERSYLEVAPIIAVKGKFHYERRTPALTNSNLFRRDLNTCAYCGRRYADHKLNRDHIIPQSKPYNGPDTWMNCVTSCIVCNGEKANRTPEEADMQLLYVPYVPNFAEQLILSNRKILACQHEFLAAMLPEHSRVRDGVGVVRTVH